MDRGTVEVQLIEESGDILNDLHDSSKNLASISEIYEKKPSEVAPLIYLKNSSDVDVNHKSTKRLTVMVSDHSTNQLEVLKSMEFPSGDP